MKLSTRSQYGLRALLCLAAQPAVSLPLSQIAKQENISFDYLEKIFSRLKSAKLIKAKRGPDGGYILARPAGEINVYEVVSALEENLTLVKCLGANKTCPHLPACRTIKVWRRLNQAIESTLKAINLKELL